MDEADKPERSEGDLEERRRDLRKELDAVYREIARAEKRLLRVERRQAILAGLDVAMNDALVVGVLDGLADRHQQLQPLPGG